MPSLFTCAPPHSFSILPEVVQHKPKLARELHVTMPRAITKTLRTVLSALRDGVPPYGMADTGYVTNRDSLFITKLKKLGSDSKHIILNKVSRTLLSEM